MKLDVVTMPTPNQFVYSQTPLQRTLLLRNSLYNEACNVAWPDSYVFYVL